MKCNSCSILCDSHFDALPPLYYLLQYGEQAAEWARNPLTQGPLTGNVAKEAPSKLKFNFCFKQLGTL